MQALKRGFLCCRNFHRIKSCKSLHLDIWIPRLGRHKQCHFPYFHDLSEPCNFIFEPTHTFCHNKLPISPSISVFKISINGHLRIKMTCSRKIKRMHSIWRETENVSFNFEKSVKWCYICTTHIPIYPSLSTRRSLNRNQRKLNNKSNRTQ